jgi:hypothetical protein
MRVSKRFILVIPFCVLNGCPRGAAQQVAVIRASNGPFQTGPNFVEKKHTKMKITSQACV